MSKYAGKSLDQIFKPPIEFVAGVATLDQLPSYFKRAEIAFAGRSNVGKSSLINALLKQDIAHTSKTPGRTQQLNFFDVNQVFTLVDMPGYGYAQVSKQKKALWDELIRTYLSGRPNLKMVFVLIDARHGIKDVDKPLIEMLNECAVAFRIILTKIDDAPQADVEKHIEDVRLFLKKCAAGFPEPLFVSAKKNVNLDKVRAVVRDVL